MKSTTIPNADRPHYLKINKAGVSSFQKTVVRVTQVSVIMLSLNQGNFIEAAIRSVLDQGIDSLEIIVADGGSTDGTPQILEKLFTEVGSRLKWFCEVDTGPAQAFNKALAMAKGSLIGWLNADDLYASGAIGCVIRHFENHPAQSLVYGRAKHIDETGHISEEYPVLPPHTPITAFRERCFIRQPAVFLRRAVFDEVGAMDETLLAAFGFELWLRLFKNYPARIGWLNTLLAYSRRHVSTRSLMHRRAYALEATRALGRHLESASPAWLLSYFDALFEHYPFIDSEQSAIEDALDLLEKSRSAFSGEEATRLHAAVRADARLRVALPDAWMTVHADGWAGSSGFIRVRFRERQWKRVRLTCRHAPPTPRALKMEILSPWGSQPVIEIATPGNFVIDIPLPEQHVVPACLSIPFVSETSFVPSEEGDSDDSRELAFLVDRMELLD